MRIKFSPNTVLGYILIYFMLIWNQTNLSETFLKQYMLPITIIFIGWVFLKSKRLTNWCGLASTVIIIFAILIRFTVGGIGLEAVLTILSSIYIVAIVVIYNRENVFERLVKVIAFLALCSLFLWGLCSIFPRFYEILVPEYNSLMTYRIYSDSENYKEMHYVCRGLFLYTMRSVDGRNSGIFTEPGVYQMVLNIAVFILLFMNKYIKLKHPKMLLAILIVTLFTSQSTTGYIGLTMLILFYLIFVSKGNQQSLNKSNILIYMCIGIIILFIDLQIRGMDSILQTTVIEKLFPNGSISLVENQSSAARVGTILLTTRTIIQHPFGVGYANIDMLLNSEETGFAAAELLRFGAAWGVVPLFFVLWWMFRPLKNNLKRSTIILYILLYFNTALAQSNVVYPVLIIIPLAFIYFPMSSNKNLIKEKHDENFMGW